MTTSTSVPPRTVQEAGLNTLTAFVFGAILVVIVNTWVAFHSVDVLVTSEQWVQHTLEVINQVEVIMSAAKDAETGNRGFLITAKTPTSSHIPRRSRIFPATWIASNS